MKPRHWYLSYDISHPKRLRQVAKLAEEHGNRIQKSLFLCAVSPEQLTVLHRGLKQIVQSDDKVMLRPLCRHCHEQSRYQGAGGKPERHEPFWIV